MENVEILEKKGVKPTSNRILVLKTLMGASRPLSLADIESRNLTLDKSSIFRVLTLFRNHDVVHAIEDGSGSLKYEICRSHSEHVHDDLHVHFHCEVCHKTYCLENIRIPQIELPDDYLAQSVNYIVKGICPVCREA